MTEPMVLGVVFLFAICLGSFINVLIYRLPRHESLVTPGSRCPKCGQAIDVYDNIPLLSYILLGGKCRSCRDKISLRYPLVELAAGILAVFSIYYFGLTLKGFEAIFLSFVFLAIFFIDLDFRIIPDGFTLPGIVIGLGVSLVPGAFVGWKEALIGIAVGGSAFYLVGLLGELLFKKEAMGFGDVKLAAMMGAFLGWQNLLLVLILASFLGSVVGIGLVLFSRRQARSTYIPFGPFLVLAAVVAMYAGERIIRAYLGLIRI